MDKEMMRALLLDGEKLRGLTGQDHGPWDIPNTEARGGTRPLATAGHGDGSTPSRFHPTAEEIETAKTPAGGWTKEQLAEWGVAWPPPKGWKERLLSEQKTFVLMPCEDCGSPRDPRGPCHNCD